MGLNVLTEGNKEEDILERCLAAMQQQGDTIEECLAHYPAQHEKLEPLLRLAVNLNSARSLQASAQFQVSAPLRLQMQIAGQLQPRQAVTAERAFPTGPGAYRKARPGALETRPRLGKSWRVQILVGLLIMLLIVSGVGTVAASAQSLPGDFLYPVKRAQENLQVTITLNGASQARLRLEFANRRINEAAVLVQENRASSIDQALVDYNDQIQSELKYIKQESGLSSTEKSELASLLLSSLTDHQTTLQSMIDKAPESAKGNIERALTASQSAQAQALDVIHKQNGNGGNRVLPTPTPAYSSPTSRPAKLLSATPTPLAATPTPTKPTRPGALPNVTRTPWTTRIPSTRAPTNWATPVPGNILTPRPKPTDWVTPTRRPTRTPVLPRPTTWLIPTHEILPTSWVTRTKPAPISNVATPTP